MGEKTCSDWGQRYFSSIAMLISNTSPFKKKNKKKGLYSSLHVFFLLHICDFTFAVFSFLICIILLRVVFYEWACYGHVPIVLVTIPPARWVISFKENALGFPRSVI